jgi:hypothetical protein
MSLRVTARSRSSRLPNRANCSNSRRCLIAAENFVNGAVNAANACLNGDTECLAHAARWLREPVMAPQAGLSDMARSAVNKQ